MLVEVVFKGNRKEFFHWEGDEPLPAKMGVIVEADRGEDLGYVYSSGELAEKRASGVPHRPTDETPVTQVVRRPATPDELKKIAELREQDEIARRKAMERVKANNLVMKLTDAEWRWDRRKLTLFFTADKRVDFRNLVRELASMFRTRIELKQIGVRDEAKRLGGIGRCGREYCSASWLPELRPVNLGVAKEQRLSLNPTQISGACGRLMCCLRYEHEFYVQQRKRFPKEGKVIETSKGEEKVVSNDIFREQVTLRGIEGEVRVLPLAELRREWRNPAAGGQPMDEDTSPIPYEAISDEVLRMQDTSEMPAWSPGRQHADGRARRGLPVVRSSEAVARSESSPKHAVDASPGTASAGQPANSPSRGGAAPGRDRRAGKAGRGAREDRADARSSNEHPAAGDRTNEPGETRGGDRRGDRREERRLDRPSADAAAAAAPGPPDATAPIAQPTPSDPSGAPATGSAPLGESPSGSTSEDEQERRLRRRRGRRGGRRGRGAERGETPGLESGDAPERDTTDNTPGSEDVT